MGRREIIPFIVALLIQVTISAAGAGDVSSIYPVNQLNGCESENPLYIDKQSGKVTWDTEEGDAGIYMVKLTVSDGNDSDSKTVRILVHKGNPLLNKVEWFCQFWLSDNMYFDYNQDGIVDMLDYAEAFIRK